MFQATYPQTFSNPYFAPFFPYNMEAARHDLNRLYYNQYEINRSFPFAQGQLQPGQVPQWATPYTTISPVTNIAETSDTLLLVVELPGVDRNDIKLEVWGNTLILTALRHPIWNNGSTSIHYRMTEGRFGTLRRVFPLPSELTPSQVQATYINGQLTIVLPKMMSEFIGNPTYGANLNSQGHANIVINAAN